MGIIAPSERRRILRAMIETDGLQAFLLDLAEVMRGFAGRSQERNQARAWNRFYRRLRVMAHLKDTGTTEKGGI